MHNLEINIELSAILSGVLLVVLLAALWRRSSGSHRSSNAERERTLKEVRGILVTTAGPSLDMGAFSGSPRRHRAFLFSAPFIVVGAILSYLIIGLLVAAIVFAVVFRLTPNKLLASYIPLDEMAYQKLLQKIKDGTGKREDVQAWIQAESTQLYRPSEVAAEKALIESRLQ